MFFETIVLLMTMTIDGLQRVSPQGSYTDNYIKIKSMMNKTFFSITFKTKNELFRTSLATKIQDKFVTKKWMIQRKLGNMRQWQYCKLNTEVNAVKQFLANGKD